MFSFVLQRCGLFLTLNFVFSTVLTLVANRSDCSVSRADFGSGLILTNMSVFPLPLRQGCNRCVSFEFLYGTCNCLLANAWKTSPNELSDLLIARVSLCRSPTAFDLTNLSDPA